MDRQPKSPVILALMFVFATAALAATNTINIFNFDFVSPQTLTHIDPTINLGDTVHWVWADDGIPHSTTAAAGQLENWDSGVRTQPFSFDHTFRNVGTFGYFCSQHGFGAGCGNGAGMAGRIFVVLPGNLPVQVTAVARGGNDIQVTWLTGGLCKTNALQRATGSADGSYTNDYADIFVATNTTGNITNYVDKGAITNFPARYYRVRMP
jgi:plastocyanin